MADGSADFVLKLTNRMSGPARMAQKSVMGLSDALRSQQKFNEKGDSAFQKSLASRRRMMDATNSRQVRALSMERRLALRRDVNFQRGIVRQKMAEQAARRHAMALEGFGQKTGAASGAGKAGFMGGLAAGGAMLAAAAATRAAGAVRDMTVAFASATFHAIDFGQRSHLALTALIGDSHMAAVQFQQVRQDAQRLGVDVFDTVDSFRKLLTAQFDIKTARELVQRTADLRALGSSADDVKYALLAISQIKMKGKLQAEELTRQLANAGVSTELVYQELEKQLGKTREEVLRMQAAGEIKADPAVKAILAAIGRKTGGMAPGALAEKMATEKVGGIFARWKSLGQNMMISLGAGMAPAMTQIMTRVDGFFQRIVKTGKLDRLGNALINAFQGFADWVDAKWPAIEQFVLNGIEKFSEFAESAGERIEQFKNAIAGISTVFAQPLAIAFVMRKAVSLLGDAFLWVVEQIGKLMTRLTEFAASPALKFVASILDTLGFSGVAGDLLSFQADAADMAEKMRASEAVVERNKRERAANVANASAAGAKAGNRFGNFSFNTTINGADVGNNPAAFADQMTRDFRGRMIAVLEDG